MFHLPRRFKSYNLNTHEKRAYNHRVLCDGSNACICGMRVVKWNKMMKSRPGVTFSTFYFFKKTCPPCVHRNNSDFYINSDFFDDSDVVCCRVPVGSSGAVIQLSLQSDKHWMNEWRRTAGIVVCLLKAAFFQCSPSAFIIILTGVPSRGVLLCVSSLVMHIPHHYRLWILPLLPILQPRFASHSFM